MRGPTLSFALTKTYYPISIDLKEKQRKKKTNIYIYISNTLPLCPFFTFLFVFSFLSFFIFLFYYYYFLFLFLNSFISFYCIINHVVNFEPHSSAPHGYFHVSLSWGAMWPPLNQAMCYPNPTPQKTCNSNCLVIRRNPTW